MKFFLLGSLILTSMSVFALEVSEFERGYNAGKEYCESAVEAWSCSFPQEGDCYKSSARGTGKSRADAILNIRQSCTTQAAEAGIKPVCIKL